MAIIRRKKIWWKKIGGGSFYLGGNKIIKPGQVFFAYEEDIPKTMRDIVIHADPPVKKPTEAETKKAEEKKKKGKKAVSTLEKELEEFEKEQFDSEDNKGMYYLDEAGGDKWNIIDWNGKVVNEKPLTKKAAETLHKDLTNQQ